MKMKRKTSPFATWLQEQLDQRGWSQRELARRAGVSHTPISLVLSGQTNLGFRVCRGIARALGVAESEVFHRAGLLPEPADDPLTRQLMKMASSLSDENLRILVELAEKMALAESIRRKAK